MFFSLKIFFEPRTFHEQGAHYFFLNNTDIIAAILFQKKKALSEILQVCHSLFPLNSSKIFALSQVWEMKNFCVF